MQRFQKTFYLGPSIILFTDDIKMWIIHFAVHEVIVTLQLKQHQGDILEQDIELCRFCYLHVTTGKEEVKFLCKIPLISHFIVSCFSVFADT
jgi:hypothetical protein